MQAINERYIELLNDESLDMKERSYMFKRSIRDLVVSNYTLNNSQDESLKTLIYDDEICKKFAEKSFPDFVGDSKDIMVILELLLTLISRVDVKDDERMKEIVEKIVTNLNDVDFSKINMIRAN